MAGVEESLHEYYETEMAHRARRPLDEHRQKCLASFIRRCQLDAVTSVVEVGCGAGRDGRALAASGLKYRGLDSSPAAVKICSDLGLDATLGTAVTLPFADDEFEAGWSMSTLMHLPGDQLALSLAELARVVRSGAPIEIGLWGANEAREWTDEHGRYFNSRTDDQVRACFGAIGEVIGFSTWGHLPSGGHYQWARVIVR